MNPVIDLEELEIREILFETLKERPGWNYQDNFPKLHRLFHEGRELDFVRNSEDNRKLCFRALMLNSAREHKKQRLRRCGLSLYNFIPTRYYSDAQSFDKCTAYAFRMENIIRCYVDIDGLHEMFEEICVAFYNRKWIAYMEDPSHQLKGVRALFSILIEKIEEDRSFIMINEPIDEKQRVSIIETEREHTDTEVAEVKEENEIKYPLLISEIKCSISKENYKDKKHMVMPPDESSMPQFYKNDYMCRAYKVRPVRIVLRKVTSTELNGTKSDYSNELRRKRKIIAKRCILPCCK